MQAPTTALGAIPPAFKRSLNTFTATFFGGAPESFAGQHISSAFPEPNASYQGRLIGVLGIARDLSDHVRLTEDLQATLQRLHEAERIARQGTWEHDLRSNTLIRSAQVHRIFGTDPAALQPSLDDFWARVHPEDRARWQQAYDEAIRLSEPTFPPGDSKAAARHAAWAILDRARDARDAAMTGGAR